MIARVWVLLGLLSLPLVWVPSEGVPAAELSPTLAAATSREAPASRAPALAETRQWGARATFLEPTEPVQGPADELMSVDPSGYEPIDATAAARPEASAQWALPAALPDLPGASEQRHFAP